MHSLTLDDVDGAHELAALQLVGVCQELLSALLQVGRAHGGRVDAVLGGGDLLEEVDVRLRVLDVAGEVVDALADASLLEMVVDPAEEEHIGREGQQVGEGLVALEEAREARAALQVDLGEQADADNLPQQAKDKVLGPGNHVLRANVDNVAANGSRRVQRQRLILRDLFEYKKN